MARGEIKKKLRCHRLGNAIVERPQGKCLAGALRIFNAPALDDETGISEGLLELQVDRVPQNHSEKYRRFVMGWVIT